MREVGIDEGRTGRLVAQLVWFVEAYLPGCLALLGTEMERFLRAQPEPGESAPTAHAVTEFVHQTSDRSWEALRLEQVARYSNLRY